MIQLLQLETCSRKYQSHVIIQRSRKRKKTSSKKRKQVVSFEQNFLISFNNSSVDEVIAALPNEFDDTQGCSNSALRVLLKEPVSFVAGDPEKNRRNPDEEHIGNNEPSAEFSTPNASGYTGETFNQLPIVQPRFKGEILGATIDRNFQIRIQIGHADFEY